MGCEWDPGTPLTHPPGAQPTHLDEGLGLQRAHCLHQAVAKLQVLLQSQRVDGQEGHVGLWGGGPVASGVGLEQGDSPATCLAPVAAVSTARVEVGNPSLWPLSVGRDSHPGPRDQAHCPRSPHSPTSCMTLCLQLCTIFCRPLAKSISAGERHVSGMWDLQPVPPTHTTGPHASPSAVRFSR